MENSSPNAIQRPTSHEQSLSKVPVTLLVRPTKVEEVKKEIFSSDDCSGLQQDLRQKFYYAILDWYQVHVLSMKTIL